MAKGMKKSANEKLRDKYGLTNVKSEPVTKKQKEVAVTQSATGGRKSSLQGAAIGTSKPTTPKKPAQIKAQDSPLLSAAKRFVSNPVGTVSDAVMKPIDDITERITSPSKKLKQEQNRLTQNQKQANSKQADVGKLLGGMAVKAADDVVSGVAGLGDMTLGTAARAFGWENNPFSQWNKLAQATQQANREYYSKNTANAGKVVQTVDELGTALVEALPQLAIAYMTAGGSLATEGAGAIAQATGRLAGTEAAQAASKLPGAIKTVQNVFSVSRSDPQFWATFTDTAGRYYNDAKVDGADDWSATMYSLATGLMNAKLETAGGIQKLPGEMKKMERSLLSLIKSAHEEGTEEPIQGMIEQAAKNLFLGQDNPIFSLNDENAVISPKRALKEYGTGAAVGFGLGAVPAIRRGIQNSANQPTPDMIAEVVKATPDPARAVQNIQAMQTRQAEQNAAQATPAASSGIQELETVKQALGKNPTFDDLINYYSQQGESGVEAYQRIAGAFERGELVDGGNSGIYTRAEIEQRQTSMPEADHIDNRTPEYNSKVSTKPFQLTHPELHPYFAEAAKALQQEAINSFSSDVPNMRKGGKIYYISSGLRKVMEMTGLSRQQISKCCQDIIDNHGAEDYASAKHVESALDHIMSYGAQFYNTFFNPNEEYVAAKSKISGGSDPNSFEYALEHEYGLAVSLGEMTEEEAYNQWRAEREARQAKQNQNGITVYRGYNRSENPLENNLTQMRSVYDAVGHSEKNSATENVPLTYYTESEEDAGNYANMDRNWYNHLLENAKAEYARFVMNGGVAPEGKEAWIKNRALSAYKTLTGRDNIPNGFVEQHTINPQKTLDLTSLGEKATPEEIYRVISRQTGISESDLDRAMVLSNISEEGDPFDVFRILRNSPGVSTGTEVVNIMRRLGFDSVRYSESGTNHYAMLNSEPTAENTLTEQPKSELPEGQGAMSAQFPYREAPSQTNSTNPIYTAEERENVEGLRPEDRTHQVRTEADVDAHADERIEFDYDGEKQDLFSGDDKEWDVVDVAVAKRILNEEAKKARESGNWDEVRRLQKEFDAKTSNWGQFGHELGRHAHDPATIVAEADEIIGDEAGNGQDKGKILSEVYDYAEELKTMRDSGEGNILDLIRRLNARRRTGGLFTPSRTGNTLNKALEAVAERGEFDFLLNVAESQIRGIASDARKISPIEAVKSVRYMSMLSKLTTVMRNFIGNNVFDPVESVSNDVGILADLLMSLRTGNRSTAFDASWASKAKRRGSIEAMQRAYIETALDADTTGTENKYENTSGRTFKMDSRNPLVRFLSTVEKWQGYALNVTDELQKGGIEAETQRGIDSLERRGLLERGALDGHAEETARERTFQNNGRMANGLVGLRNAANSFGSITDSRGGSFGLGDAILPFARVPANVVGQFLNYSPAGFVKGAKQMLGVMAKGKKATAQEQAAAARAFGRGVNGTAILTLFAAAAANGFLNVADGGDDDDEKDLARLRQTEGITGTQFNISAAQRWLDGKGADWRDDDDIMNIGFLEPINGLMALGSLIWDSAQDEEGITAGDIASATAESALQAISDLPAVSSLTNIFNNYKYSTADTTGGKIAETAVKFAGDTATSIIPNALSGIAQGMDEGTIRDTYSSEKSGIHGVLENTLNAAKAKIPGEKGRESLPTSLDNFGQERKTTASPFMNWLNSNILPGSITKYQTNAVKQELERLMESGADVSIPNRSPEKKVDTENGEKKLTTSEKRNYQKTYGGETFKGLNELFQSSAYKSLNDDEKAEAEKNVVSFATAKAKQSVGGKAEDPTWATKSDGTMAQNAVYNAQYKTARNTAKQATGKDNPSDGEVLVSLSNRGLDYDTTVKIMAQFMEPNTIKKYETAYADGYDFGLSAAFSGAYYEKSYDFGTTDAGNPKQRGKDNTIAWAQENLGLTRSQAIMLYNYLIKR